MSARIAGHVRIAGHENTRHAWKLWVAAAGIAALTVSGFYMAITRWQDDKEYALMLFGCFIGPAVAAAFGYFWCLPEVLGGVSHDQQRTLLQKWSDFALLCSFIGILVVEGSYLRVIWVNFRNISLPRAIAVLVLCPWALAACIVASKDYLSWTMTGAASRISSGWRARVRVGMERWGGWLIRPLTTRAALVLGGAFVLISLVLVEVGEIFGPDFKGYEIVAGANLKPPFGLPVQPMRPAVLVLLWTHRGTYLLGILLAGIALLGVVAKRAGRRIQGNGMLARLAGILSLLEVSGLAVTWRRENTAIGLVILWLTLWAAPVVLWLMSRRGDSGTWNRTRVAIMVFYLPIFLVWVGFFPLESYLGIGYGAFMAGMLLVWWGFVQGGHEVDQNEVPILRGGQLQIRRTK